MIQAVAGELDAAMVGERIPIEGSLGGQVLRSRRAERLADAPARLRFRLAERVGAQTGLLVPLVFRDQAVGVAAAFDRVTGGPEFSAEDERLMEAFAASAATAVATAQTVETQALERSVEASELERRRWARELHDDSLQELAAVKLRLGALARVEAGGPARRRRSGDRARRREHPGDAQPHHRHAPGLARPARRRRPRWRRSRSAGPRSPGIDTNLDVDLRFETGDESTRLTALIETTIYRVVQEALTNVAKHAGAQRVSVTVVERDGAVEIAVTDDGSGFSGEEPSDGFGLIGMRERIRLAGGRHDIESSPGEGTTVHAWIPASRLDPAPAARAGSG